MAEGVRLFVGTEDGLHVFRSAGDSWQKVNQGVTKGLFWSMSGCRQRPERVFVATSRDGLYRTDDGGAHWTRVLDRDVRSVTVDPTDDRVVYAGTEPVRLFRSEDGGDSWHELDTIQTLPLAVRKEWWFPLPPHGATCCTSLSSPRTHGPSTSASSMEVSFAASIAARPGRM